MHVSLYIKTNTFHKSPSINTFPFLFQNTTCQKQLLEKNNPSKQGHMSQTLSGHSHEISSIAFDANDLLASASHDRTVKIWHKTTGNLVKGLAGHSYWVGAISFDQNGRLASGSGDNTVKLWDTMTGEVLATLIGHNSSINCVATDGNGLLASGSRDTTVKLWDTTQSCVITSYFK